MIFASERTARTQRERLRPAAQALLWTVYADAGVTHTSTDAVESLGYDRMTLSRSIRKRIARATLPPSKPGPTARVRSRQVVSSIVSPYLALRGDPDERLQQAPAQILSEVPW